jgi:hypothetical protein
MLPEGYGKLERQFNDLIGTRTPGPPGLLHSASTNYAITCHSQVWYENFSEHFWTPEDGDDSSPKCRFEIVLHDTESQKTSLTLNEIEAFVVFLVYPGEKTVSNYCMAASFRVPSNSLFAVILSLDSL